MKILVTGCCGMIGFHVTQQLLFAGFEIVGVDNFLQEQLLQHTYQPIALKELNLPRFQFINSDVLSYNIPSDIDAVVHLAAYPGVPFSFNNPSQTLYNNNNSFIHVLEYCKNNNKPLLFASSSSIYGNHFNVDEQANTYEPLSVYALSKKQNEDTAQLYSHLYDTQIFSLRFFTVFGKFARPDMLVHKIMDSIYHNKTLTLYQNGELKRDYTFVNDISRFIYLLLHYYFNNQLISNDKYQIFNLGSGGSISNIELVHLFEKQFDKSATIELIDSKPVFDPVLTQSNAQNLRLNFPNFKFTKLLNSISETSEWYLKHQNYLKQETSLLNKSQFFIDK